MGNKKKKKETPSVTSRDNTLKFIIPALILTVIVGIWFIKNNDKPPVTTEANPDFALNVTEQIDLDKLKSYGLPIMIDFGADSCAPCKAMAPVLVKLNKELQGKAIILFADVWKNQQLARGYPIKVIPTQVFFDEEGKPYTPSDELAVKMKMHYSDNNEHIFTTHEGGMTEEAILEVLKDMGLEE